MLRSSPKPSHHHSERPTEHHIPTIEECAEIHPGKAVAAYIEYADTSVEALAKGLCISVDELEKIIDGNAEMDLYVMRRLAKITKMPLDTWTNLQRRYEKALAEAKTL